MTSTIKLYLYLGAAASIAIVIGLIYAKGVHDQAAASKIDNLAVANAGLDKRVEESGLVFGQVGAKLDAMTADAQVRADLIDARHDYLETVQAEVNENAKGSDFCGASRRDFELWNSLAQPASTFKGGTAASDVPDH